MRQDKSAAIAGSATGRRFVIEVRINECIVEAINVLLYSYARAMKPFVTTHSTPAPEPPVWHKSRTIR